MSILTRSKFTHYRWLGIWKNICRSTNNKKPGSDSHSHHPVAGQLACALSSTITDQPFLQDSFYKKLSPENSELAFGELTHDLWAWTVLTQLKASKYDFDHPDAIDMDMFAAVRTLYALLKIR